MSDKTFYITTPIYYINDVPHIGHAYCTIACDVLARYKRLKGYKTFFLTGSDENSQKTIEAAKKSGKEVSEYTDEMSEIWKETWKKLGITNNDFIRTTEERHREAVIKVFKKIEASGDVYKGKYQGLYCDKCEAYYKEEDLENGLCPQHLSKCKILEEENYFFRLSDYGDRLLEYYEKNPDFIQPEYRRREVISFVKEGLDDISISRVDKKWGIPYPGDSNHVFYVWFDALINYISGIGFAKEDNPEYWPASYHVLGKDIVRFHCIIWPAMLMSAGIELPESLFVHGFFTINGLKISKSLGNAIDPVPIADRFGRDPLRYYLFAEFPFGQDGDFSFPSLVNRLNTELADDLGNLLSRTLAMTEKFLGGKLQRGKAVEEEDGHLANLAEKVVQTMDGHYNRFEYARIIDSVWKLFRAANKYAEDQTPWALAKEEEKKERLREVLYNMAEVLRFGSYAIRPLLPETSDKILAQLGLTYEKDYEKALEWGAIPDGTVVSKGESLFPKIELSEDDPFLSLGKEPEGDINEREEMRKGEEKVETIEFEDFTKVNLKVGKILEGEEVEGADKLLCFQVDLGEEKRQIVSGIAPHYSVEDMVGKNVIVVTNLAPRKIFGVESQGMLLAASDDDQVVVATLERDIEPGSSVT